MDTTTEPRRGPSAGADVPAAPPAESRRRIGEIFVELGFITSAQLESALDVQRQTGARIGEILVEQGAVTRLDLASALAEHWEPRRIEPSEPAGLSLSGLGDDLPGQQRLPEQDHAAAAELEQRLRAVEERLEAEHAGAQEPRTDRLGELMARLERVEAVTHRAAGGVPEARLAEMPYPIDRDEEGVRNQAFDLADELRQEAASTAAEVRQSLSSQSEEMTALRAEAASLGARVDEVQALRAADARAARAADERLGAAVEELARRLEEQAALAEEQVRATEHAVRRGLASLGRRIVRPDVVDAKPGKGLRRSIDRLGAAIVEADARQAGQIPSAGEEGYVAFVPTADGYRLLAFPGSPPEPGGTVELPWSESAFVVIRVGRSPLPFDARPCAYLELR